MSIQMTNMNVNINQRPPAANVVVVQQAAPPPSPVIVLTLTERQSMHQAFYRDVVPSIRTIETLARNLYEHVEADEWNEKEVLRQLRDLDNAVENVVVAMNLRFRPVIADGYVQTFLVRSFKALARALEDLKARKGGGCCCCCKEPYNGSKKVKKLATVVYDKVARVHADFKISIDVNGSANMIGTTNLTMDVSATDNYATKSATPDPKYPGPPDYS